MLQTTPCSPKPETAQPTAKAFGDGLTATVFSFPVMCAFLLIAAIFGYSSRGITESDIWWHLCSARNLLQFHSFSPIDTNSFTAAGSPRLSWEWLSELPFFLGFKAMGLQGILLVYFTVLAMIFAGVYYRACRAGADCKDAAIATLGGICLGGVSMAPRMLLFGWLCLVGLLLVLDRFLRNGKGLWILSPLFALWINLHPSWVFGMVVLGVTIASGLLQAEWGLVVARRWTSSELQKLLLALAASLAALFFNPFGYKLVLYPFNLLFHQQGVMQYIEEWQPVDFSATNGKLALIAIFALLLAALFSRRRWRLDEAVLTAFALWAALSHVRFLFFAGLIMVPILAPRLKLFPPYEPELDKPWLNAIIIAAIVGSLIFFFPTSAALQQKVEQEYPRAALQFMQQQHINGRIFNQYKWGGYMEWNAPEFKAFIDGRADIFVYNGVFEDFLSATALKNSLEILDKYKIDHVFLQPREPLDYLLEHSAGWRLIYSDKVAVLFERTPASAAAATLSKGQSN